MSFANPQKIIQQFSAGWGWHVGDFGCGSGAYVFPLAEAIGPEGAIYAVDIRKGCLERLANTARERGIENVAVIRGDIENERGSSLHDNSLNAAIAANCISQLENRTAAVQEIVRTVKPRGRILVVDWARQLDGAGPARGALVSPNEMKQLFAQAGCDFEREIQAGDYHYGQVFKKR